MLINKQKYRNSSNNDNFKRIKKDKIFIQYFFTKKILFFKLNSLTNNKIVSFAKIKQAVNNKDLRELTKKTKSIKNNGKIIIS